MAALVAIETVVLVLLAVLVAGLLRSHATILRRLHDLGAGLEDAAPAATAAVPPPAAPQTAARGADLAGTSLRGEAVAVSVVGTAHDTLLAFLSSNCLTCERFWDAFRRPATLHLPETTRLVVVTKDAAEESPSRLRELAAPDLDVVLASSAWADYQVPGSPYIVYVAGATGHILGQGTGMSWDQVAALLAQATGDTAFTTAPRRQRRSKPASDAAREAAIDQALLDAGVRPGDPSLYAAATPPPQATPGDGT